MHLAQLQNLTPETVARHFLVLIKARAGRIEYYKDVKCDVTVESLAEYLKENWSEYRKIHRRWVSSNLQDKLRPTIDRIDSKGHYAIGNIRFITLSENAKRAVKGRVQSREEKSKRRQVYFDIFGDFPKPRRGFHATRNLKAVLRDGVVKPMRLPCVYIFKRKEDAMGYMKEFGYEGVVEVEYYNRDVGAQWRPRYANGNAIFKLKNGKTAKVIKSL